MALSSRGKVATFCVGLFALGFFALGLLAWYSQRDSPPSLREPAAERGSTAMPSAQSAATDSRATAVANARESVNAARVFRVVDDYGRPVSDATVHVWPERGTRASQVSTRVARAVTGANG